MKKNERKEFIHVRENGTRDCFYCHHMALSRYVCKRSQCLQSRSSSMNLHHVKIIQEQSDIHYSLFSVFYYSKGLDHLYYMKQTLVVSQSVRAFAGKSAKQ